MFANLKYRTQFVGFVLVTAIFLGLASSASSQQLFFEDFEDETLAANAAIQNTMITGGVALMDDAAANRATFSVVQDITAQVVTFSFDIVEPVTESTGGMELLLRAGVGTAQNTLQNADQIVEAIIYRGPAADPTRGDYQNNGNESIFLVANNKSSELTFTSPVDGVTQVTLPGFFYIPYVKNNETGLFGQIKGQDDFTPALMPNWGTFNRFGIGSSSTAHVGTFGIDNVLVVEGVSFVGPDPPPPAIPGDTDGDMIGGEFPDDFDPIKTNFRKAVSQRTLGDLVDDNIVNFKDFREWKAAHLAGGGSLEGIDFNFLASVPEPGSLALLLWAACGAGSSRRLARVRRNSRF